MNLYNEKIYNKYVDFNDDFVFQYFARVNYVQVNAVIKEVTATTRNIY